MWRTLLHDLILSKVHKWTHEARSCVHRIITSPDFSRGSILPSSRRAEETCVQPTWSIAVAISPIDLEDDQKLKADTAGVRWETERRTYNYRRGVAPIETEQNYLIRYARTKRYGTDGMIHRPATISSPCADTTEVEVEKGSAWAAPYV